MRKGSTCRCTALVRRTMRTQHNFPLSTTPHHTTTTALLAVGVTNSRTTSLQLADVRHPHRTTADTTDTTAPSFLHTRHRLPRLLQDARQCTTGTAAPRQVHPAAAAGVWEGGQVAGAAAKRVAGAEGQRLGTRGLAQGAAAVHHQRERIRQVPAIRKWLQINNNLGQFTQLASSPRKSDVRTLIYMLWSKICLRNYVARDAFKEQC